MGNRSRTLTKRRRGGMKCAAAQCGAKGNCSMDINSFMSGNQSFNQSLYAPLTRDPLVCRPAVYFMRKVYMNRRPILRWVVSTGVAVQLAMLLCSAPLRAQTGMPSQPGSSSGTPFGSGSADSNFSTFDSEAKPETPSLARTMLPVTFTVSRGIRAACPWLVQGLSF